MSKFSMADREAIKTYQTKFGEQLEKANAQCGSKLKATYDLATESPQRPTGEDAGAGYQWCGDILKGIAWECEHHAEAKATIAAKLDAVKCSFDPGSGMRLMKDKNQYGPEMKLTGKTLEASYDWNTANTFDETGKWLEHSL